MLRAISSNASGSGGSVPQKIAGSAIPFIIAPTGSMANNGAITLGTALDQTYVSAYVYLPASAIQAGSGVGWYYTVFASATVGQVFNNTYVSGTPAIPASPLAFVSTGPGAFTGVTTAVVGPQLSVPAGAMGPNGILQATTLWSGLNNANTKTLTVTFGGTTLLNGGFTSVAAGQVLTTLYNRSNAAINVSMPTANNVGLGTAGASPLLSAINTAAAQTLAIGGTLSVATDYLILEAYQIAVIPG